MSIDKLFETIQAVDPVKYARDFLKDIDMLDSYSPMYRTHHQNACGGLSVPIPLV